MSSQLREIFKYVLRNRKLFILGVATRFLSILLGMFIPLLIKNAIQSIMLLESSKLTETALWIVLLMFAEGFLFFVSRYIFEVVSRRSVYHMRLDLYRHLHDLSYSFYDRVDTGEILVRVTSDMDTINRFIRFFFMSLSTASFSIGIALYFLLSIDVQLTLITLIILPLIFITVVIYTRLTDPILRRRWETLSGLNTSIEEYISGIKVLKAMGIEDYVAGFVKNSIYRLFSLNIKFAKRSSIMRPTLGLYTQMSQLIVLFLGGLLAINGVRNVGDIVAFLLYFGRLTWPMVMLGFFLSMYQRAKISSTKIFEVMYLEPEIKEGKGAMPLKTLRGEIEFRNVTFGYEKGKPIVKSLSFKIAPGEKVAIVGGVASGKSTILKLIPRFYDPWEGEILLDGIDIRRVRLNDLRSKIGIVHQDVILFSGSIRDNISYGKPSAKLPEIRRASEVAGIREFIESLPKKYNTIIGERGITLSAGQRQRISIARTILTDPKILILDDPTSNLDSETEERILKALKKLMENRTVIIVSQRPSMIRMADRILVLKNGRVVEEGTHEELLSKRGEYFRLFQSWRES